MRHGIRGLLLLVALLSTTAALAQTPDASVQTQDHWSQYDQSLRECRPDNIILPSNGSDIFAYIFDNNMPTQISLNIQGWHDGKCALTMTASVINSGNPKRYCELTPNVMDWLLDNIVNQTSFNDNNALVTMLQTQCQETPFTE